MAEGTEQPKKEEPKVKVLRRIVYSVETVQHDKALKASYEAWLGTQDTFDKALKAATAAKKKVMDLLIPKLASKGIHEGMDWRVRADGSGDIIVEVVERKRGGGRGRVPTEKM